MWLQEGYKISMLWINLNGEYEVVTFIITSHKICINEIKIIIIFIQFIKLTLKDDPILD